MHAKNHSREDNLQSDKVEPLHSINLENLCKHSKKERCKIENISEKLIFIAH